MGSSWGCSVSEIRLSQYKWKYGSKVGVWELVCKNKKMQDSVLTDIPVQYNHTEATKKFVFHVEFWTRIRVVC